MFVRNKTLCENMNKIRFRILDSGYARIGGDDNWKGTVANPTFSRLYFILDGEFHITGPDGTELALTAGNCYLLPAEYSFQFRCKDAMEQVYFHVKLCDFNGIDMLKCCTNPISYTFPRENRALYRSLADAQSILDSLRAQQEVYASLYTLLEKHQVSPEKKEYSPPVRKAIKYIESHLSLQLTLQDVADNAFTASSTLTRKFKQETGMTIGQYIDESVMFQAEQMLRSGGASIQEISEKFGFCDQFYFTRRFKEKFKMSPRDYRKSTLI